VAQISGRLLDGTIAGHGFIDLDRPFASRLDLMLDAADLSILDRLNPALAGLEGKASGSLRIWAQDGDRPLEPLCAMLSLQVDGRYRQAQLAGISAIWHIGPSRIICEGKIHALEGVSSFWLNSTKNPGTRQTHLLTEFNDLDLRQLMATVTARPTKARGRLFGSVSITIGAGLNSLAGHGQLRLRDADLKEIRPLASLLRNLPSDGHHGSGELELQWIGRNIQISNFLYTQGGSEIRGQGRIADLALGSQSTVEGFLITSTRPLKGLKVPGIADLDRMMTSLQRQVTAVQVSGTLADVETVPVPFLEISRMLRALLWTQLR
jgi:hypothetical protein